MTDADTNTGMDSVSAGFAPASTATRKRREYMKSAANPACPDLSGFLIL